MEVEVLVVPGCANESATLRLLRSVLDELGLADTAVRTTVIVGEEDARRRGFVGSPTVLIDGADPFLEPGREPALACRVYLTGSGLSGVPDRDALRRAVGDAVAAE